MPCITKSHTRTEGLVTQGACRGYFLKEIVSNNYSSLILFFNMAAYINFLCKTRITLLKLYDFTSLFKKLCWQQITNLMKSNLLAQLSCTSECKIPQFPKDMSLSFPVIPFAGITVSLVCNGPVVFYLHESMSFLEVPSLFSISNP